MSEIYKFCIVCGKEFTPEELDTINTDVNGLHGQHENLEACASSQTDNDLDCDCFEDGYARFAHPQCCQSCNLGSLFDILFSLGTDDNGPTGTVFQGGLFSAS